MSVNMLKEKLQRRRNIQKLYYVIRLRTRFGFFIFANAQKQLDQANRRLSFYGYWLTQFKLFSNFYNNLTLNVLKKILKRATRGRIVMFNFFLTLLESRIDSLLIRLNWVHSKHMIRQMLRKKWFLVNDVSVLYPNYILSNFEFLTVHEKKKEILYKELIKRVRLHHFFYKPPFFLETNHRSLTCLIIQQFVKRHFVKYPFSFKSDALLYISYAKR